MENLLTYGPLALEGLAYVALGLLLLCRLLAPLTKNKLDDKAAGLLGAAYKGLLRLLVGKNLPPPPQDQP